MAGRISKAIRELGGGEAVASAVAVEPLTPARIRLELLKAIIARSGALPVLNDPQLPDVLERAVALVAAGELPG